MVGVSWSNAAAFFNRIAFAVLLLALNSVAKAQEKVSFPSTDSDLKGGAPTVINGYLYRPSGFSGSRRIVH
jgi:hypothetical protein